MRLDALARENHNGVQSDHGSSSSLPGSTERILKFELQMYKMRDGEYCIDIQVSGMTQCTPCLVPIEFDNLWPFRSLWDPNKDYLGCSHRLVGSSNFVKDADHRGMITAQRLIGELFLFMDLCGGLLSRLHV